MCGRKSPEAERRGDFAELAVLTQRKLELDRALCSCSCGAVPKCRGK